MIIRSKMDEMFPGVAVEIRTDDSVLTLSDKYGCNSPADSAAALRQSSEDASGTEDAADYLIRGSHPIIVFEGLGEEPSVALATLESRTSSDPLAQMLLSFFRSALGNTNTRQASAAEDLNETRVQDAGSPDV